MIVTQRVRADVARDTGGLRDPGDHAVAVAAVDRFARDRPQHQRPLGPIAPACLEDSQDRDSQRHGGVFGALPDQVQHAVPPQRLTVVLDPYRGSFGGA